MCSPIALNHQPAFTDRFMQYMNFVTGRLLGMRCRQVELAETSDNPYRCRWYQSASSFALLAWYSPADALPAGAAPEELIWGAYGAKHVAEDRLRRRKGYKIGDPLRSLLSNTLESVEMCVKAACTRVQACNKVLCGGGLPSPTACEVLGITLPDVARVERVENLLASTTITNSFASGLLPETPWEMMRQMHALRRAF